MTNGLKSFLVASSRDGVDSTELGSHELPCVNGSPHARVVADVLSCAEQLDAVPAVVILDVVFDPAAVDIVRAARKDPKLKRTPFVALAADGDKPMVARLYDAGVNSIVPRPDTRDDLRALLDKVRGYWVGANHIGD